MGTVPVVDLADFLSIDINKKSAVVNALGKAYKTAGFVSAKNHDIPDKLIRDLYNEGKQFFSLLLEKEKIPGCRAFAMRK